MNHGPAWIIIEESFHKKSRRLVSVLSPRRSHSHVVAFIEQLCVDRSSSIVERMEYKKSRKSARHTPMLDGNIIHCGHEPWLIGYYAHKTAVKDGVLEFSYRIVVRRTPNPLNFEFEERRQCISVDA
jgi:hypothetical protein